MGTPRQRGGGQKWVYQEWPDTISPTVNFVLPRDGPFGLGGGGVQGAPPPLLLLRCTAILILPCPRRCEALSQSQSQSPPPNTLTTPTAPLVLQSPHTKKKACLVPHSHPRTPSHAHALCRAASEPPPPPQTRHRGGTCCSVSFPTAS